MGDLLLNNLKSRSGIDKKALGRGIGSGCGKTCSYGHKGGKARSGRGTVSWFEGGQMPLYRRLPKRGFVSLQNKSSVSWVNLGDLQRLYETKVISVNQNVDIEILKKAGIVRTSSSTVRLLANGKLTVALQVSVGYASAAAIRGIEAVGGKVQII